MIQLLRRMVRFIGLLAEQWTAGTCLLRPRLVLHTWASCATSVLLFLPASASAQSATQYTIPSLIEKLEAGVSPLRLLSLVAVGCVEHPGRLSSADEQRLRATGADDALVNVINNRQCAAAPAPSARPPSPATRAEAGAPLGVGFGEEQFATIPAGSFRMGKIGSSHERPVRTVTLSAFRMQKTEVTQAQWRQVMQGTGLDNPSKYNSCGDTCPVERVSWNDIQTFVTRLNQQDPGKGYRLPTEAEWEYAARAGTTGDYGGNGVLNDMGWWSGNSAGARTRPAAQKLANAWGLFDMHGNVWEWVNDWYSGSYYRTGPNVDPPGPSTGSSRVLRGGAWHNPAYSARSATRMLYSPFLRYDDLGFRLARTP